MKHSYIIIDDDPDSVVRTQAIAAGFQNLHFVASAGTYEEGLNLILEHNPKIVFLEIDPEDKSSNLSLLIINELYRYLKEVPKIIITTKNRELAYEALKYEVFDYFMKPLQQHELRRSILKFEKTLSNIPQFFNEQQLSTNIPLVVPEMGNVSSVNDILSVNEIPETHDTEQKEVIESSESRIPENLITEILHKDEKPLIICVKSYGDYRFIEAKDICYLQADNNSTDIHLYNGEMITAFKTLKHFESVLSSPFVRIHNSYIVNIDYVSRIHTGNAVCYIKNTTTKLPFSKSYKENVDSIINSITNGNYLEI